jgi:hypothetical protein
LTSILNNRTNDEIVDVDSQRGGLLSASQFDSRGLTGQHICVAAHLNNTLDLSGDVSRKIKALLNQSATTGPFSAYSLTPTNSVNRRLSTEGQSKLVASVLRPRPTATETISVATPVDGQVVTPGSSIEVVISASPAFTSAFVATQDQVSGSLAQPFHARIDIPVATIGQYSIVVQADTVTGDRATASITLNVAPNARIASLIIQPLELFLSVGDIVKPFVRGAFDDGVTRDLSRSTSVAFASSDPSVVSALADGSLRAVGPGNARVTVSSEAASAEVLINVESVPRRRGVNH